MMAKSMLRHEFGQPRILMFPGSLRRDAHQRRLLGHFLPLIEGRCQPDILESGEVDLPLFDQDLEQDPTVIERAVTVHGRFATADGFIVTSPEYNDHVSPYLKNTLDWESRQSRIDPRFANSHPFRGKPFLLASASTGWTGGLLGVRDARTLFGYLGCLVPAEQICVSDAAHCSPEGQFRFEPAFAEYIAETLDTFCRLMAALKTRDFGNGSSASAV